LVEGVDVGFFELGGFGAGEAHGQEDEAVAGDALHRASLVLFIFVFSQLKIERAKFSTAFKAFYFA